MKEYKNKFIENKSSNTSDTSEDDSDVLDTQPEEERVVKVEKKPYKFPIGNSKLLNRVFYVDTLDEFILFKNKEKIKFPSQDEIRRALYCSTTNHPPKNTIAFNKAVHNYLTHGEDYFRHRSLYGYEMEEEKPIKRPSKYGTQDLKRLFARNNTGTYGKFNPAATGARVVHKSSYKQADIVKHAGNRIGPIRSNAILSNEAGNITVKPTSQYLAITNPNNARAASSDTQVPKVDEKFSFGSVIAGCSSGTPEPQVNGCSVHYSGTAHAGMHNSQERSAVCRLNSVAAQFQHRRVNNYHPPRFSQHVNTFVPNSNGIRGRFAHSTLSSAANVYIPPPPGFYPNNSPPNMPQYYPIAQSMIFPAPIFFSRQITTVSTSVNIPGNRHPDNHFFNMQPHLHPNNTYCACPNHVYGNIGNANIQNDPKFM